MGTTALIVLYLRQRFLGIPFKFPNLNMLNPKSRNKSQAHVSPEQKKVLNALKTTYVVITLAALFIFRLFENVILKNRI